MKSLGFLNFGNHTYLKYLAGLNYNAEAPLTRLTKIICTIGPASRNPEILEKLIGRGLNIARLNFSHGSHEYHAESICMIRQAAESYKRKMSFNSPIAIALDTKGPEIRTGLIEGSATNEVTLETGGKIALTPDASYREKCTKDILYMDYENMLGLVKPGNRVFVDDGLISLVVDKVEGDKVHCKVENGGKLGSQKGINLPDVAVDLPAVSERDKKDLRFGVEQGVDFVFASFIRTAEALHEIRSLLGTKGQHIKIISKIENHEGMKNIDDIIDASDGIMVARGDLGIEIPTEKVFVAQKTIIARCNRVGKPVVCATQMLESMTKAPRPTRAEASDVANAVLDGADCVMLSGETAKGTYPEECVQMMSGICKQAEDILWYPQHFKELIYTDADWCADSKRSMAIAAVQASFNVSVAAILVVTTTGESAYHVSRYHPRCPILMVTDCEQTARHVNINRGIISIVYKEEDRDKVSSRINCGLKCAMEQCLLKDCDSVLVLVPPEPESGFKESIFIKSVS